MSTKCPDCKTGTLTWVGDMLTGGQKCDTCRPVNTADDALLDMLADKGVTMRNGKFYADCRRCENEYELYCDLDEFNPDMSYCGGSDRCIP